MLSSILLNYIAQAVLGTIRYLLFPPCHVVVAVEVEIPVSHRYYYDMQ